jgi:hypothetical protein
MGPILNGDGPSNIFTDEATNEEIVAIMADHQKRKLIQPFFPL